MAGSVSLAFAHPGDRAARTAGPEVADRLLLTDYLIETEIGAFQPERGRTQRLRFNIAVEVRHPGDIDDDVDRILSYDRITEAIDTALASERLNLLETLAERVAALVLADPLALRIFIRIEKLDLGPGALGVEIVRVRQDVAPEAVEEARPHIVVLGPDALCAPQLPRWLDDLEEDGLPAILCVGGPAGEAPEVGKAGPQRRIDLLELEQSAWTLAARDPRCVVVGTRTELDWAMRRGRISVWAPSKMVLDATDPPEGAEATVLALWLARDILADRVTFVGVSAPAEGGVRTLRADTDRLTGTA